MNGSPVKLLKTMPSSLLPPSPNWYCSRASDTNQDGILGFATKNTVFLLNIKTNPASAEGILHGHCERVTGISFCTTADQTQLCATSSDDCMVKVWDVKTKTITKEHKVHQFKVTTLHWSPILKDLIVSGDEKGALVCWDLASNDSKLFIPESNQIFSLACSPHNAAHVAVGYKNALVLLIDINNKGNILQRMRGHEDEIHSICWAPSSGEILPSHKPSNASNDDNSWRETAEDNSQKEDDCLLLTGSKDRTIRVWDTANGKTIQTLRLPPKGFQRTRDRGDDGGRGSRVWVALWWIPNEKTSFISSSHSGDVVRWDLSGSKPKWECLGSHDAGGINMHMRIVFNISQGPTPDTLITTSMDRKLICWNCSTLQADWCLSSLGGFVYCIAPSPLDQSRLAIGVGDNMIRVWNTASPGQHCDVTVLWQGIKAKVTAVCWHPTRENCLAYATDDGRVGVYNNITQSNKPPILSSTFHRKTVYALSWGPPCPAKSDSECALLHLYSCGGEGAVLQHDSSNLQGDAVNMNKLIRDANNIEHMLPQRTDVSWCPDGRAVAMGNEDGSIDVFAASNLLLLCTIHVHHKLINCLKWYPPTALPTDQSHPGSEVTCQSDSSTANVGVNSSQSEQQRYWLASGSNDPHVHVYDLNKVLGPRDPVQLDTPMTSSMCCLSGHTVRVTALSWSPHGDSRLVSASYDGTAQVWDVMKGEPLYNYRGHRGRIFTCHWSATDEDVIYTGSEDFTLRKWKISECENKYPPKKKKEALFKTARFQSGDAKPKKGKKQKQKKNNPAKSPEATTNVASNTPVEPMVASSTNTTDQSEGITQRIEGIDTVMSQSQPASHDDKEQASVSESRKSKEEEVRVVSKMGEAESSYMEEAVEVAKEPSYMKIRKDRGKKKKQKSLFPVSCGLDNRTRAHKQADCIQLAAMKYGGVVATPKSDDTEDKETTHLGFFSDRKAMYDVFRDEAENHNESGYFDQKCTLGLWKGNILVEIEEAKQSGTLSDMTVGMAAIGGPDVWLEICEAYAQQLEKREDFIKAANYYVACHQIQKAIQVLMNNRYHREAAAMATVRLPYKDPLLIEVYDSWAVQLEKEGSFEQAAKCFLAIDQPADAIRLLCKKGDPSSLRAGLEVAILSQQETMATRLMARYVNECMLAFDWSQVQQVTSSHELLQAGQLLLQVHETMAASWVADDVISAAWYEEPQWSPWQQVVNSAGKQVLDSISSWPTRVVNDIPLLEAAVSTWAKDHHVDLSNKDMLARLYHWINKTKPQGTSHSMAMKQLLIYLSSEVILGHLSVHMNDVHQAALHWLQAMVTCHNMGEYDIAKALIILILPKGKTSIEDLRQKALFDQTSEDVTEIHKKTGAVLSCLEAYYSLIVLYYLWWDFGSRSMNPDKKYSNTDISQEDGTNSIPRITVSLPDTVISSHEHMCDDITEPSVALESNSVNGSTNATQVDQPDNDQPTGLSRTDGIAETVEKEHLTSCVNRTNSASLFAKLEYMSQVLLSDSHAKFAQLKHKLSTIQQAVARLVSRHKEHESTQRLDTVSNQSSAVGEGDAEGEAMRTNEEDADASENVDKSTDISCPKEQSNTVSNIDETTLISSDDKPFSSGDTSKDSTESYKLHPLTDEGQSSDNLLELTATLNGILKDIAHIPVEIKEHPFPEPVSSAMTLVYFTKQAARVSKGESHGQLSDLRSKIATWGHQHSLTEQMKRKFAKYLVK
ncbi:gem-associated protein 5-like [Amphiura filiformis]|uniref:gem-associated protein 5-like n=1 Tax=Amphiura filiformis TaxID=82378 RepID=UPI003B20BC44